MVHADAAGIPGDVVTKADFYAHVESQIAALLDGQRNWVTNLANVSSVLYNSMNRFSEWNDKRVNWAGFYILSPFFPGPTPPSKYPMLWLGPFCGLPACQMIPSVPGRGPRCNARMGGRGDQEQIIIGVLDIDCEEPNGFGNIDTQSLERILIGAHVLVQRTSSR
ncbi:L-methionine (R)-S-oxide reductase [Malassezia sp. CBS 17886]|nr:L-methionine (R)-S-oxide reductase [Malassezia sp. CBS 17886]